MWWEMGIFTLAALTAVWTVGRPATAGLALAVFLAWANLNERGWAGFDWSWEQGVWYLLATLGMIAGEAAWFRNRIRFRGRKPAVDYVALVVWGVVQQAVLLGWLAQIDPVLAVLIFGAMHLPNPALSMATFVGGAVSVSIATYFGEPSILLAGLAHAAMSLVLRDFLGLNMRIGVSYKRLMNHRATME